MSVTLKSARRICFSVPTDEVISLLLGFLLPASLRPRSKQHSTKQQTNNPRWPGPHEAWLPQRCITIERWEAPRTSLARRFFRPAPSTFHVPQAAQTSAALLGSGRRRRYLLVGINCPVFLAMVMNHVSPISPTAGSADGMGRRHAGAVLLQGQWWRIVTAMFVHVGILHLATNMWCLWNLGLLAEPLMGSVGLLGGLYAHGRGGQPAFNAGQLALADPRSLEGCLSGRRGSIGRGLWHCRRADRALKSPRLPVPALELKRLRRSVIYFAGINLVIGFSISAGSRFTGISIDNLAHLGGFPAACCLRCRWCRESARRTGRFNPGSALQWS